jgi:hypothetical protein
LCGRFVCAQMALRCSIQRGVRILYTYTCVHTHTVYYTPLARKKKVKKKKKKAVCGRLDAWLMNAGFPPTRRNPPECSGPPDLTAQPARSFAGGSLRVAYNIPYSTYGIPKRLPMMVVSIHKNRISFLLFYIQVGRRNVTNRYYY